MLLDPRLPFLVGIPLVGALVWTLYEEAPMPGDLSLAHGELPGFEGGNSCRICHQPEGLTVGCLSCHDEIESQLDDGTGYHGFLDQRSESMRCETCHQEHHGEGFRLVNEISWEGQQIRAFDHPHVDYGLSGSHLSLNCAECHVDMREAPFVLADFPGHERSQTFLGLSQTCGQCHDDPHANGLVNDCSQCHGQETFGPPEFDHGEHFPLSGGHGGLQCSDCHEFPDLDVEIEEHPFPFHEVRGKTCAECHETPHRVAFQEDCNACHRGTDPLWTVAARNMTAQRHLQTGFDLMVPHDAVACQKCHEPTLPYDERHPDPADPHYDRERNSCQGCHEDVHRGQFEADYNECRDCHDSRFFVPTNFGHAAHANEFVLAGAHKAVDCTRCHEVEGPEHIRQFAGTPNSCKECHQDPHAGQFADRIAENDCTACHRGEADTFRIQPFDHTERTGFELEGAHAQADCRKCHVEKTFDHGGQMVRARRFPNTPKECASCHKDVHRGQFEDYDSCSVCHVSQSEWHAIEFDHNTQSRFVLEGAHLGVTCQECHQPVTLEDESVFVRYKPLGRKCVDCHEIDSRNR